MICGNGIEPAREFSATEASSDPRETTQGDAHGENTRH